MDLVKKPGQTIQVTKGTTKEVRNMAKALTTGKTDLSMLENGLRTKLLARASTLG